MSQFSDVASRYGAPMGRRESPLSDAPRSVRLFRVRLDAGGYDDGGAYWGHSRDALYCAECDAGGRQFVRANSRLEACIALNIRADNMKVKPARHLALLRERKAAGRIPSLWADVLTKAEALGF